MSTRETSPAGTATGSDSRTAPAATVTTGPTGGDRSAAPQAGAATPRSGNGYGRFLRSELKLVLGRRRNLVLLGVLGLSPLLLGVAVAASNPGPGSGPEFLYRTTENGLFLVFTALAVTLPLFLPLAVAVASGDAVAGEAASGTLRQLLVVPIGRSRLLAVKYAGVVAFAGAGVLIIAVLGLLVGLALFPHGTVTLLSGVEVGYWQALGRTGLICLYVLVMLAAVAAIGIAASVFTDVPMAAMATVAVVTVTSEIADTLPQLSVVHPFLFTHPWLNFGDLLRSPISWSGIADGVAVAAVYAIFALSLAWARLNTKDITT